jgi:hypothetical protein
MSRREYEFAPRPSLPAVHDEVFKNENFREEFLARLSAALGDNPHQVSRPSGLARLRKFSYTDSALGACEVEIRITRPTVTVYVVRLEA